MTTDLVLWAPLQLFNARGSGGPLPFPDIRYRPPRSTMDPRFLACTQHRVACDCREAEHAEEVAELRSEVELNRRYEDAIEALAALHGPKPGSEYCAAPGCLTRFPCPTRNIVAPLSWRLKYETDHTPGRVIYP